MADRPPTISINDITEGDFDPAASRRQPVSPEAREKMRQAALRRPKPSAESIAKAVAGRRANAWRRLPYGSGYYRNPVGLVPGRVQPSGPRFKR